MKIQFPIQSSEKILTAIRTAMAGRSLGDIVSLSEEHGNLIVKISKMGTSTLQFDRKEVGDKVTFALSTEKIALAHRAFKDQVKDKLVHVIQKAGGTLLE